MTAMQTPDPVTARLAPVAAPDVITPNLRDKNELVVIVDPRGHVEWTSPLDLDDVVALLRHIASRIKARTL